jgi:hypothetical protein
MPSTAQHEATVSVEVYVVQMDTNGLLHKTVHTARHPVQNNGAAMHSINTGHIINFSSTIVLDRTLSYMYRLVKEAIGIHLNDINFNRDGGLMLSRAWHPWINVLSNQKARLMQQALDRNQQPLLASTLS